MSEDRGIKTREKLFMALLHEIGAIGYERTTVAKIVKRAKSSKGAFYHHFKSKDDLLKNGLEAHMKKTRTYVLNQKISNDFNPEEMICSDIDRIFDEFETVDIVRGFVEMKLLGGRDPKLAGLFKPDQDGKTKLLTEIIKAGQAKGFYRQDVKPKEASDYLYASIFGAYYVTFSTQSKVTFKGLAKSAQDNVRHFFKTLKA